jgi:hypothetical protein
MNSNNLLGKKPKHHKKAYTREKLNISWSHDEKKKRLYVNSILGTYFFEVPGDWSLKKWSLACRNLAEVLIFQAFWEPKDFDQFLKQEWIPAVSAEKEENGKERENKERKRLSSRQKRNVTSISFSGGLDSCAIAPLLEPGFFMGYLKRDVPMPTMMRHGQQLLALKHIKKHYKCSAYIMNSDIELIARYSIGRIGFPSEYACTLPCVIMADHVGITHICTGTIGLFLRDHGFHDFSKSPYYRYHRKVFKRAGIELFWPVGCVVDRGTSLICSRLGIPGQSCVRNDEGQCNKCFKCFRKNIVIPGKLNKKTRIPEQARNKLSKKPLTLIELYQKGVLTDSRLAPFKDLDISYQSHYMKECCDYMVPPYMKEQICEKLDKLLGPMSDEQVNNVKKMDISPLNGVKIDLSS